MSGNSATTGQTRAQMGERFVCAAASCCCRDLVHRPTAGKTEFVKSELPLMRKNTDPYPCTPASQSENSSALGTAAATEQQGSTEHACAHANSTDRSSPGATVRPRSLLAWVSLGVKLRLAGVCAHMSVHAFPPWPALSFHPICASVQVGRVSSSAWERECNDK